MRTKLRLVMFVAILAAVTQIYAQTNGVAIGSGTPTPNASAVLDVQSSTKGLLIPRIALTSATDATTISSPATSLLVYNTGTGGLTPAGYYYNSATSGVLWTKLSIVGDTTNWTKATTVGTKALKADNQYVTGDVGIGDFSASSPSHKLHVKGGIRTESGFIANDGTASIPSYRFDNDGNTGMYRIGNDVLGMATNGLERVRSDANGNIGINQPSPAEKLDVIGNVKLSTTSPNATTAGGQIQYTAAGISTTTKIVEARKSILVTTANTTPSANIFNDGYMRFGVYYNSTVSRWVLSMSPYNNQFYDYNYIGNTQYYNGTYYYCDDAISNYVWILSDDINTTSGTYYEIAGVTRSSTVDYATGGHGSVYAEGTTTTNPYYEFSWFLSYTSTSTQRMITVTVKAYY